MVIEKSKLLYFGFTCFFVAVCSLAISYANAKMGFLFYFFIGVICLVFFCYFLLAIFLAWKLREYFKLKYELGVLDDYMMGNVWSPGIAKAFVGERGGKTVSVTFNRAGIEQYHASGIKKEVLDAIDLRREGMGDFERSHPILIKLLDICRF